MALQLYVRVSLGGVPFVVYIQAPEGTINSVF